VVASGFSLQLSIAVDEIADIDDVDNIPVRPCAVCGRAISPERLEVLPDAVRCVVCQQKTELDSTHPRVSELLCPRCAARGLRSRLIWRTARDPNIPGYFLGCSLFPECRYTET
jgi:DksA/TraR C4-type zinc finger protein